MADVNSFSDIDFIVGSGTSQSALLIDFNDGSKNESLVWGYRYDTPVSGAQMLVDVAAADPLLDLVYSNTPASGFFISSISYDGKLLANAYGATPDASTDWGYYLAGGTAGDPPSNGISGGGTALPASWAISPTGASADSFGVQGRFIADGSWDAWSYGTYTGASWAGVFNHVAPPVGVVEAAPVPEPRAFALTLGLVCLTLSISRRKP